jgi:hypothetical protein
MHWTMTGGALVRTLAILMLMTPAASWAQVAAEISPGQSISGVLEQGDPVKVGRAYDDYQYSTVPGTRARVVVRSSTLAVDVNVYFYDEYFDLLSLASGGAEAEDTVEFMVPDAGLPTVVVIRVSTLAEDPGPGLGEYTIELSERREP